MSEKIAAAEPSLREMFEAHANKYKYHRVDIHPKLFVMIRTMSGPERQQYDRLLVKVHKTRGPEFQFGINKPLLVAMTLCAKTDCTPGLMYKDVDELLEVVKDSQVIEKIFEKSALLNGLVDEDDLKDDEGKG